MLRIIERATRQVIEPMNLPTVDAVNELRITKFKLRVSETVAKGEANAFRPILEQLEAETGLPLIDIAAALASLGQGATPLLLGGKGTHIPETLAPVERAAPRAQAPPRPEPPRPEPPRPERPHAAAGHMETFRIEVGSVHGIKPGNIVGAIANEAGIDGVHIGRVDIREDHSFVDLPEGMPKPVFKALQKVRVAGLELKISKVAEKPPKPPRNPAGRHVGRKLLSRRPTKS